MPPTVQTAVCALAMGSHVIRRQPQGMGHSAVT